MTATRVPDVVTDLVGLLEAATDVKVLRGPSLASVLPPSHLVVGVREDGPGVTAERTRLEGYGRPRYREDWTVGCLLVLTDGGSDVAPLEETAAGILDALDTALRDSSSTATWETAEITGRLGWGTLHTDAGVQVAATFTATGWCWL